MTASRIGDTDTGSPATATPPSPRPGHREPAAPIRRERARRTKIVATIGPASDSETTIAAMAAAGMNVARIPLAHGSIDDALDRVRRVRRAAPQVGIMADLPGPKIRTSPFPGDGVTLASGSQVTLTGVDAAPASSAEVIGVADDALLADLQEGDRVALGDGGVSLTVTGTSGGRVTTFVTGGGHVQGRPGVTAPSSRVALSTPTPEDVERLHALVAEGVDTVAVSFVRGGHDIEAVRAECARRDVMLVAKIETIEAVTHLNEIVAEADAVMVARGDLGVRVPLEDVPHIQASIIRAGVSYGRPVITATQMLESMVTAPVPTRAEVTDVANAVLAGTSAVMLSGETAVGVDPVRVVQTMARIVARAERDFDYTNWGSELGELQGLGEPSSPPRLTAAITAAAWRAALEEDAICIIACTRSGTTARAISRFRPSIPIVAATPSPVTASQLTLSWGVDALLVGESTNTDDIVWFAVEEAVKAGYAHKGEVVVVLAGSPDEVEPVTDTLRLVRIH